MSLNSRQWLARIGRNTVVQTVVFIAVILLIANLNALVDTVLHPDISYFDQEHIVVGGVTAFVCALLFVLLLVYVRHLHKALNTIKTLESLLRICCHCKKMRKPNGDSRNPESWQSIESYVTERTDSQFTHGICPECMAKYYGPLIRKNGAGASAEVSRSESPSPPGSSISPR